MNKVILHVSEIIPPFDFSKTALWGKFTAQWDYDEQKDTLTIPLRLSSDNISLLGISSEGSVDNPSLKVVAHSRSVLNDSDKREIIRQVTWCLGLDQNLEPFYKIAEGDRISKEAVRINRGLKMPSCPTVFEIAVKAISVRLCTPLRSIKMMKSLCQNFGDQIVVDGIPYYTFPTPMSLHRASVEQIKAKTGVGFRATAIKSVADSVVAGQIDIEALKCRTADEIIGDLKKVRGIGNYTAELVLTYLRHFDRFALDNASRPYLQQLFFQSKQVSDNEILALLDQKWGPWKELAMDYIFFDHPTLERNLNLHIKD